MALKLLYSLVPTVNRLTFSILWQDPMTIWMGDDDGDYHKFTAPNGYEVISRSRMDIQTERVWLLGAKHREEPRSGSMVFSSNAKRDVAHDRFVEAINAWATSHGGHALKVPPGFSWRVDVPVTEAKGAHVAVLLGDGSVLRKCVPQFDGDLWWGGAQDIFIDPERISMLAWAFDIQSEGA